MRYKIIFKLVVIFGVCMSAFLSCTSKFDDYNTNNNATTIVTPGMLATNLILGMTQVGGAKASLYTYMLNKQIAWAEGSAENDQYNLLSRVSFGVYTDFTNCQKMIKEAQGSTEGVQKSYNALAKFIKAYELFYLSMEVGDIPYSDSNNAEGGNLKPKYDTQKNVMLEILKDLDDARSLFAQGETFSGDPIFNGAPANWLKVTTGFELKVLINLSKKIDDKDLNIKERFAKLVSSGNLMTSNDDNFQLVYSNTANQLYPLYQNDHDQYLMISSTIVDPLKKFKDYRLFYYANPSAYQLAQGLKDTDWDSYLGIDPSAIQSDINTLHGLGKFSGLNNRYIQPEGEPITRLSYMEQNFILAEAALRGWIDPGKTSYYYKKGIQASMDFIVDHTAKDSDFEHGHEMTQDYITNYLSQDAIQLNGNFNHDLEMILLQKYLGSYLQLQNNDLFYDNRRTGYPVFPLNPKSNLNTDPNKFPVRWMYPQAEIDYNGDNLNEALKRQYNGNDSFDQLMWILQ